MPLDEFIGIVLENPNGSFYKVVDVNGLKGSSRKYKIECSVCSEDTELYPELWSRKGDLLKGKLCCGCARSPQFYTKVQWEILCKRHAIQLGVDFIGLDDNYSGFKTKVSFIDTYGNIQNNMTISYFLKRYDTKSKVRASLKNVPRYDEDYYSNRLIEKFNFPKGTLTKRVYEDGELTQVFSIFCPVCASSDICKDGIRSPWFDSPYSSIAMGYKPCFCSPVYRYTKAEYIHRLKVKLEGIGTFIEILEPFNGNSSLFKWECNCGAVRVQRIADFLSGKRCSNCAVYGFKDDHPANLYAVLWKDDTKSFIKVGITNNSVAVRIRQQGLITNFKPTEILQINFSKGFEARKLEKELLSNFPKDSSVTKDIFPDGYTEVLESESFHKIRGILEDYARNHQSIS